MKRAVLLLCLVATVFALRPLAPTSGSYTWEIIVDDDDSYIGGKSYFDYVAGYTREDVYDSWDNNPGITQVSVYDFRDNKAIVTTIDESGCTIVPLTEDTIPAPYDWSSYTYVESKFFNKHLAEHWRSKEDGSSAYFDVFTHDLVGLSADSFTYRVLDWTDSAPDGTVFHVPDTIKCNSSIHSTTGSSVRETIGKRALHGVKCSLCKSAVTKIKCGMDGAAAACPGLLKPVCSIAAKLLCESKLSPEAVCKSIRMC